MPNVSIGQSISPVVFSGQRLDSDRTIVGVPLPDQFGGENFISEYKEIARNGQVIPGDDRTLAFSSFYQPGGISQLGNATFVCNDNNRDDVLLHYRDDSVSVLLHQGGLTPDGTARPSFVWRYTYTEQGNFAFFADVFADYGRQTSLFLLRDGALQEVARTNREIGDTGITTHANGIIPFGSLGLSQSNEVAFPYGGQDRADGYLVLNENGDFLDGYMTDFRLTADDGDFCEINVQGTTLFSTNQGSGVYLRQGGNIVEVFRNNALVPNGNGQFRRFFGNYNQEVDLLNENNEVAFSIGLQNTSLGDENNEAVFRYSLSTAMVEVVRKSEPLPDRLGNFTSMEAYDFNDRGQVLLGGTVGNSGLGNDFAYYIHEPDGSFTAIVKRNEQLLGSTIDDIMQLSLNEQGQVAFGFIPICWATSTRTEASVFVTFHLLSKRLSARILWFKVILTKTAPLTLLTFHRLLICY